MNIKYRKILYKIPAIYGLLKRILQLYNWIYYHLLINRKVNNVQLSNIREKQKCFIVGNGPSLDVNDLEKIIEYDCFASNLIFKIFPKTNWRPKYYFVQDRYARIGDFLDTTDIEYLFVGDYFWRNRTFKRSKAQCYHSIPCFDSDDIDFSMNLEKGVFDAWTVTYVMLQFAVNMGYKEIYLLGIDHNYPSVLDCNGNVIQTTANKSHFFEDENKDEIVANVIMMEGGYIKAKNVAGNMGIIIKNVTRGGKLEVFDRENLDNVI